MESGRSNPRVRRQAIIIIHGIGEQRPMNTLRSFVEAFRRESTYYSKPDKVSGSYELRRIKLKRNGVQDPWPETNFFEYYWAHHMSGTRWPYVLTWIVRVLSRGRQAYIQKTPGECKQHEQLKARFAAIVLLAVGLCFLFVAACWHFSQRWKWEAALWLGGIIILALPAAYTFLQWFFLDKAKNIVGDAARYFDNAPANVSRRYDILRGGIDLLRALHEEKNEYAETDDKPVQYTYDRIVLVGHSLGSVIAYDLLKHYWADVHARMPVQEKEVLTKVEAFKPAEQQGAAVTSPAHTEFLIAQHALWRQLNGWWLQDHSVGKASERRARWLVTDLVTLGSPLSYGTLLLADSVDDFIRKTRLRELPICPPDRSTQVNRDSFSVPLSSEVDDPDPDYDILMHSSMFAITRWTNFYFPGDWFGGRLGNVFGEGVYDVRLSQAPSPWLHPVAWCKAHDGLKAHTSYWDKRSARCLSSLGSILTDPRWPEQLRQKT
jgi:hypothetical protein